MNRIEYDWPASIPVTGANISFQVKAHLYVDAIQTTSSVRQLSIAPKRGAKYPFNDTVFVQDVEYTPVNDHYWQADITYSNDEIQVDIEEFESPWKRRPEIRYTDEPFQTVVTKYYENDEKTEPTKPILNSAGDQFVTPPVVTLYRTIIDITWWVRSFKDDWIQQYRNSINLKPVVFDGQSYPAKMLYLTRLTSHPFHAPSGKNLYQVDAQMIHDPRGHNFQPLQAGFNAIKGEQKNKVYITEKGQYNIEQKGSQINDPMLLNKDGGLLTENAKEMAAATPVYGNMRYLKLADWKGLAIPGLKANPKRTI